jgi:hypothetical protein
LLLVIGSGLTRSSPRPTTPTVRVSSRADIPRSRVFPGAPDHVEHHRAASTPGNKRRLRVQVRRFVFFLRRSFGAAEVERSNSNKPRAARPDGVATTLSSDRT